MPAVDRNILRLAVYEMSELSTPAPVVIDEALELARQFSGDESVSFINGVLDAVHREQQVNPLRVVLVAPRNPLNIGAAARAMSNFGFSELRLVNPYEVAFREARSAVKSQHVLRDGARISRRWPKRWPIARWWWGPLRAGHRALEHPLRRLELGGQSDRQAAGVRLRSRCCSDRKNSDCRTTI